MNRITYWLCALVLLLVGISGTFLVVSSSTQVPQSGDIDDLIRSTAPIAWAVATAFALWRFRKTLREPPYRVHEDGTALQRRIRGLGVRTGILSGFAATLPLIARSLLSPISGAAATRTLLVVGGEIGAWLLLVGSIGIGMVVFASAASIPRWAGQHAFARKAG